MTRKKVINRNNSLLRCIIAISRNTNTVAHQVRMNIKTNNGHRRRFRFYNWYDKYTLNDGK